MNESSDLNHPGRYVRTQVIPEGMSVTRAAEMIGVGRPALSNFLNGNAALSPQMAARLHKAFGADGLMARQAAYDSERRPGERAVLATTRSFVPPFLMAKANDLEDWANTHEARAQLAVLLRVLVHSTCGGLEHVDFPGNDDAQRPGWDGRVETREGNPWVPAGTSAWEFGTNGNISKKANEDYAKRTAATGEAERSHTAFVFVTPRRWHGKEDWLRDKRAEGKWRTVITWDASDIEQWLEQSLPAQAWFVGLRGLSLRGVKSLDRCWVEWCADCEPRFTEGIFAEAMSVFGDRVRAHLRDETNGVLRIAADSRQEGLAFLRAFLSRPDDDLRNFMDKAVVFTEPGPLSELAVGSPGFLPVISGPGVAKELAQSGCALKGFVVEPRTAVHHEADITLDPLSHQAFREGLAAMGLGEEEIVRLGRESGRSLTILRRRLSQSEAIRSPNWSSDEELAQALAPMMLAGAWVTKNEADQYLMCELAGYDDNDYDQLESNFTRLLNLEDSPVWSIGGFHGVVSKLDALYGVHRWVRAGQIGRFIVVAEVVLSERDPALGLAEDAQWAAPLYGKSREISSPLRKSIAESLVLLAIHGDKLFGKHIDLDPKLEVAGLVRKLLEPLKEDKLRSQFSNLPLYAEAAPETFLEIFEKDLSSPNAVVATLMEPIEDILIQRRYRVDLLRALELLAWHPKWLDRVVALLAGLAELEPDDNLANKPSASLQSIFQAWMPQTAAPLGKRIAVFNRLAEQHPEIAWSIATSQFEPVSKVGDYSHKPCWRDYALGFGEVTPCGERRAFVLHCIETCLDWPKHTRETLAELMGNADALDSTHLAQLGVAIGKWAADARDKDRVCLRERIRMSAQWSLRRKSRGKTVPQGADKCVLVAQKAFKILEPRDLVWKHAGPFENTWTAESWDELEEDIDLEVRSERNRLARLRAVREVLSGAGHAGVLQLAFSNNDPNAVGGSFAEAIENEDGRLAFLRAVLEDGNVLTSAPHQFLISGLLHGVGVLPAIRLMEGLWLECGEDVGTKLLCLCGFDRLVWSKVEGMGNSIANKYWAKVQPSCRNHSDEDINYAVSRLLAVDRPRAALDYARPDWGRVDSGYIHGVLSGLPKSNEAGHPGAVQLDAYSIQRAFKVLEEREALSRAELARLEFLYLELFLYGEGGATNLEKETEANPELFCEAVMLVHRREDSSEERAPTEGERSLALKAHRLLDKLARVPGHDSGGILNADTLTDWIGKAQELCGASGRRRWGDHHIGQLLSNAPVGEDDVWPCAPVREALEAVLNDNIREGFLIGRRNARGVHRRTEGGGQERELAGQYEEWAKAADYSYPKVAAVLRELASSYQSEGRWQDQEAAVQRRLGY